MAASWSTSTTSSSGDSTTNLPTVVTCRNRRRWPPSPGDRASAAQNPNCLDRAQRLPAGAHFLGDGRDDASASVPARGHEESISALVSFSHFRHIHRAVLRVSAPFSTGPGPLFCPSPPTILRSLPPVSWIECRPCLTVPTARWQVNYRVAACQQKARQPNTCLNPTARFLTVAPALNPTLMPRILPSPEGATVRPRGTPELKNKKTKKKKNPPLGRTTPWPFLSRPSRQSLALGPREAQLCLPVVRSSDHRPCERSTESLAADVVVTRVEDISEVVELSVKIQKKKKKTPTEERKIETCNF